MGRKMRNRSNNLTPRRQRRGLTLMEAMISLSITTMLLAGIATSFVSSANAVSANEQFSRATQATRVTMNQILVECRRADAVQCSSTGTYNYFDVIRPTEVLDPNEVYRRYRYDATNKQITLTIHFADGTDSPAYVMVRNVQAATFGPPQMGVDSNNASVVQRLPVTLTIKIGGNVITLNGAAGPRRALRF
jgi:type II secretory pathway pseudopilin PulG